MPPASKRRRTTSAGPNAASSNAASAKQAQSTLSFRSSKAGARATDAKKSNSHKQPAVSHESPLTHDISDVDDKSVTSPQEESHESEPQVPAISLNDPTARILQAQVEQEQQVEEEAEEEEVDEAEVQLNSKALSLSEAKIKSYWTTKESERTAPRVHQKGLTVREKVLREFDMSSRFGPSIGITRLSRWRRANSLGLNPPIEVLAVLLKEEQIHGKGDGVVASHQRSIMDDLILSSRMAAEV